jgi:DNA repair protein RecO (recombination protein O)
MPTPVNLQPAYVLHTRNYRETSLIVDLFTPDYGRISAVAKGARRPKSQLRGVLQPFRHLLISWSGKQTLKTLHSAEDQHRSSRLQGAALYSGLYLNELLVRLLRAEDHHDQLFVAYERVLAGIVAGQDIEPLLREFEQYLLTDLGYGLPFPDELGYSGQTDPVYYYDIDGHFNLLLDTPSSQQLARSFSGKDLQAIASSDYREKGVLRSAKRLMRLALAPLLGDRPLYSRTLFKHFK